MNVWIVTLPGPEGTVYEGGKFEVEIDFRDSYPFKCPNITFVTKIYHPNISNKGEICAEKVKNAWVPTLNAKFVVETC